MFSIGPIVAMVWEGHNAIKGGRKLIGATNPDASEPGSIRGDLCVLIGRFFEFLSFLFLYVIVIVIIPFCCFFLLFFMC